MKRSRTLVASLTSIPMVLLLLLLLTIGVVCLVSGQQPTTANDQQADSLIISPSPRDYVDLYKQSCTQHKSRTDLLAVYQNKTAPSSRRLYELTKTIKLERECRREPSAWRYRYIDEDGAVEVRESSIDERMSNVVYTARATKAFAIDSYLYDWGDKEVDAKNMELVAGPQVNDELCGEQVRFMLKIMRELEERNQQMRAGDKSTILTDQHISLAKILDSYGRYASGLLYGRIVSTGSYDQCRTNRLVANETNQFRMRYCWAHMSLEKHLDRSLNERYRDELETDIDVLTTGICIPDSCHSKSFAKYREEFQALLDSQFRLPNSMYVDETLPIQSIYCLVDENSAYKVPLFGKLILCYALFWVSLCVFVTWRNNRIGVENAQRRRRGTILDSLDLRKAWAEFLDARERAAEKELVELNTINVVKSLGSLLVVLAHSFGVFIGYSMDELYSAKYLETDPVMLTMVSASMLVDTFFAISGILWGFLTLKILHKLDNKRKCGATKQALNASGTTTAQQSADCLESVVAGGAENHNKSSTDNSSANNQDENSHKTNTYTFSVECQDSSAGVTYVEERKRSDGLIFFCATWATLTIFRYLRIVPLFALIHWFKKFVFIYAGSGPLWDHGFNQKSFSGSCRRESMWTPFTFMSAYYPLSHQCTLQSWSISNDMFFAILAPPSIMLIYKRPRTAILFTLLAGLLSLLSVQWAIINTPIYIDEELRELRAWGFYRFFDKVSTLYTAPHYRIFCFLIGVWGGYFLHRYQLGTLSKSNSTTWNLGQVVAGDDANRKSKPPTQPPPPPPATRSCWPWWMCGPLTWFSIVYIAFVYNATIFSAYLRPQVDPIHRWIYPQFVSSIRFVWALSNTVLFLRMMTDWKDNFWMRMSSGKFWQIFTKLNYPILLVHMDLLIYTIQVARAPPNNLTVWAFINMGMGVFLASVPISVLLHVLYEIPMDKLIRSLLPKLN